MNNNKIGFIARGLTNGGVTRFIDNVLKEFDKRKNIDFYLFTDNKKYLNYFSNIKVVFVSNKNKLFWDYFKILPYLKKYNLDLIIYPKNIIPLTHLLIHAKKYNIIHDLGYFEKDLNAYKFWDTFYMTSLMKISCKMADKILAVSEFTKEDIVSRFNIEAEKIGVANEAVENDFKVIKDEKYLNKIQEKYNLKQPFLFYCGSISPRKNVLRMLKAFNEIKNEIPHNFYLTGRSEWNNEEVYNYIKQNNLTNRVEKIGFVEDEDLPALYNLADLLLFPSLYEGFGLPILEAQACGCPVVTSNVTSCPEVAGEGAEIVNPYEEKEISNAVKKILNNDNYKKKLIERGFINFKKYSWQNVAKNIIK
jgi:glycosyltransferase involved in cell wall biosynthesis